MANLLRQFDGTQWLDVGVRSLDDLTDADTTTTAPANGDGLVWNGTNWVPQAPAAGTVLPTAGAGLTGGAASYDVGAGSGITVAADTVALDTTFTDARYVQLPLPAPPVIPAAGAGLAGGVTAYDVGAGTGVIVAADTVALDKAYTDTLYSPVTHGHALNDLTDADTAASAPAVGDALVWDGTAWVPSGPAIIAPPTPTLLTHATRWADTRPRFANAAARDAAYLTIGGPVEGMSCWLADLQQEQTWLTGQYYGKTQWFPTGGTLPWIGGEYTLSEPIGLAPTVWAFDLIEMQGGTSSPNASTLTIPVDGQYGVLGRAVAGAHPTDESIFSIALGIPPGTLIAELTLVSIFAGVDNIVTGGVNSLLSAGDYCVIFYTNVARNVGNGSLYMNYVGPA